MQNTKKPAKKQKKLIYQPYLKGNSFSGLVVKRSLRIVMYQLIFTVFNLLVGTAVNFDSMFLRLVFNLLLVAVCGMMIYVDGTNAGTADVALGEICYQRKESGKNIDKTDMDGCYHPLKGWLTALVGAAPLFLVTLVYAVLAQKQVYTLQSLPSWVQSFSGNSEISNALQYYTSPSMGFVEIMRVIARFLTMPYYSIIGGDNANLTLLFDRLSPLLVSLPALAYPIGYFQGPRLRAQLHGAIASSNRKAVNKKKKEIKARQEKKNQII